MTPKVSINVLNYNTYDKSRICIDSCLKQKGEYFRVLLIDNCSTDDSFERLKSLYGDRIDYLQTGKNYGFAGGNNIGVKYALSKSIDYALLLNSDTELVGCELLSKLLKVIAHNSRCAVVAPTIFDVTQRGRIEHTHDYLYNKLLRKIGVLPSNLIVSPDICQVSEAHGSALLVDCKKFMEVGGFPEHYFMYCEESTFAKNVLWAGYNILWLKHKKNFILHHHDKSGAVDSWREILMGRNRSLEYHENRKHKSWLWFLIYNLFKLKMYLWGKRTKNLAYYKGMCLGDLLYRKGYSKEECFSNGINILNTFMNQK